MYALNIVYKAFAIYAVKTCVSEFMLQKHCRLNQDFLLKLKSSICSNAVFSRKVGQKRALTHSTGTMHLVKIKLTRLEAN